MPYRNRPIHNVAAPNKTGNKVRECHIHLSPNPIGDSVKRRARRLVGFCH